MATRGRKPKPTALKLLAAEWTKSDAKQRQIRADYTKRKQKERD